MTGLLRRTIFVPPLSWLLLIWPLFAQAAEQEYLPKVGQPGKDVVWVPNPTVMVEKLLDMAGVTSKDYVIDLGSGDGRNVIAAAKRGARAHGVEYDAGLVELSKRYAAVPSRRTLLAEATARLREAGVASPDHDAAELLAHVLGTDRGAAAAGRRRAAARGRASTTRWSPAGPPASRSSTSPAPPTSGTSRSRSGPGVFVPRPETELLAGLGDRAGAALDDAVGRRSRHRLRRHRQGDRGRGARTPRVHAVELDPGGARLGRAQPRRHRSRPAPRRPGHRVPRARRARRRGGLQPAVHPAGGLGVGRPRGARPRPAPGAVLRGRRPGRDPRCSSSARPRCCGPGEWSGAEHADVQGESAPAVFAATGRWTDVRDHRDLAGRPRFLTARRGMRG